MSYKTKIEIGKFYMCYGGNSHPAYVFAIDSVHNTIKSIKFGTTKAKHMTEIHPLQEGISKQFVHNRPFEGVRSDYGDKELLNLKINEQDLEIINEIMTKESNKSKRAKLRYKKCRRTHKSSTTAYTRLTSIIIKTNYLK